MRDPAAFDDPGPPTPDPPSPLRRVLTVVILVTLIIAMVFLAFVSGRGVITIAPDVRPRSTILPAAIVDVDTGRPPAGRSEPEAGV